MTKRNSYPVKPRPPRWGRWLVTLTGALVLVGAAISCRTVNRAVVVLPNVPGAKYIGSKECETCHEEIYRDFASADHARLLSDGPNGLEAGCESCHGPGEQHAGDPRKDNIDRSTYAACIRCHEANPSRPKWHKQVVSKDHYTGSKCTECHVPHSPSEVP